jgi:hypothetical protein
MTERQRGVRQGAVLPGPERKNPVDLTFESLRTYWYDAEAALNWVFPIDTSPYRMTKLERLGFRV